MDNEDLHDDEIDLNDTPADDAPGDTSLADPAPGDDGEEATARRDSELEEAETEEEREAIREKRRKERKNRNQKQRERFEAQERNIAALMAQNAELQQRVSAIQDVNAGAQLAQVDNAIAQANQAAEHYKKIIAEATAKQDGRVVAEATEYMIASRQRAQQLTEFKTNATRAINAPKPLNPALVNKSQQFLGKNTWYGGPQSADPDSKVLTALDNSLTAEGWDATSDAYWSELESRAKKYLPHRFQSRQGSGSGEPRTVTRSPVSGGNTASGSGDRGNVFTLSPERVAAIKSAGMWDDPVERKKMITQFRNYDLANKRS